MRLLIITKTLQEQRWPLKTQICRRRGD